VLVGELVWCFVKAKREGGNFSVSGSEFLRKMAQKRTVIFGNVFLRALLRTCREQGSRSHIRRLGFSS